MSHPCLWVPDQREAMARFNLESILSGIYYFRCHDHTELLALVNILPEFLHTHPQVRAE